LAITLAAAFCAPAVAAKEGFTLVAAIPDDVFICSAGQHNEERAFLHDYWSEIIDALKQSGIGSDLMELIGTSLGEEQAAEIERLRALASELLDGVDWKELTGGEVAFAERMNAPTRVGEGLTMLPEFVVLFRGGTFSTAKDYEGLVAILQAIVEEINKASDEEVMTVETAPRHGAKVTSVNVLSMIPEAPRLTLAVALRDDVIIIALGDQILGDVLGLLEGDSSKKPLTANPRYKQAFAKLPAAEDNMTFFDMQVMLGAFREFAELAVAEVGSGSKDTITSARFCKEANQIAAKGVVAYQQKDYQQALEYTKQAHEAAPGDSRIMYNLACFHALVGHKDEALTWLDKAVDGGFRAPKHIARDSDLDSVRSDPRYEAALGKAVKHLTAESKKEVESVKRVIDRIMDVPGMIDYIASVERTEGYTVHVDDVTVLVPGADEKPFYPVFGKRKPLTNFDRYLPKETVSFSVCGGFDLGELYTFIEDTVRGLGPKGDEYLAKWAGIQEKMGVNVRKDVLGWVHGELITVTMKQPLGQAWVGMLKVTDEAIAGEKLTSALEFLSTSLQEMAQENPMLAMLAVRTAPTIDERLPGFHNVTVGMMPEPAVCGVKDGYLILGTSAEAVALCLATAAGEHPNIRENTELMGEAVIPKGSFRSVSFTDKRNLGTEIAQIIGVVSMAGGMAAMVIPEPDVQQPIMKILRMVAKLGPVAQKIDFYKSSAEYATFDGKVWHTRSVTNYRSPAERVALSQSQAEPSEKPPVE
jgi:tetratricopeptide (TPR) repeat protein